MSRRRPVPRTEPGAGIVMVQTPLASLLDATVGVDAFLTMVRSGMLDINRETTSFLWGPNVGSALEPRRQLVPAATPEMQGVLSWRRGLAKWSLDATHAMLGPDVHYWSSVSKGIAQVRLDGVRIPDTILATLPGMALADVVGHPHLQDRGIKIVSVTSGGPYGNKFMPPRPAMTSFKIVVPTIDYLDPAPIAWDLPDNEETTTEDAA